MTKTAQRTRDTIARVLDCQAETLRDSHRLREDLGMDTDPRRNTLARHLTRLVPTLRRGVYGYDLRECATVGDVVAMTEGKANEN